MERPFSRETFGPMFPTVVYAIAIKTIRSALRSHVVHVVLALLGAAILMLPLTIADDGTAQGHVQVSLNYSLGVTGILLSLVALWLGCTGLAEDIETYQMHLVVSKPVGRWQIWLGRWLGIILLQGALLALAATVILVLTYWRIRTADFPIVERRKLGAEVMVARRLFMPEKPDLEAMVQEELQRRLATGSTQPAMINDKTVRDTLRRQLRTRLTEVPAASTRFYPFAGLPVPERDGYLSLRYRLYVDSAKTRDQRVTHGNWLLMLPPEAEGRPPRAVLLFPHNAMAGGFQQVSLPARLGLPDGTSIPLVQPDGGTVLAYQNLDPESKSVVIQEEDGPALLIRVGGFTPNYVRVVLLLFLQIVFLAALGCTCGAGLSTPVAIFMAAAYLVFGGMMDALGYLFTLDPVQWPEGLLSKLLFGFGYYFDLLAGEPGVLEKLAFVVRSATQLVVVPLGDFNEVARLAQGELLEFSRMGWVSFTILVLRGLPIALLGIWVLTRRELGLVVRR